MYTVSDPKVAAQVGYFKDGTAGIGVQQRCLAIVLLRQLSATCMPLYVMWEMSLPTNFQVLN